MSARQMTMAVALVVFCAVSGLSQPVLAEAQQQNPLFLQAQAIAAQVGSSSMPADVKAGFAQRFDAFSAEQQNLWSLAGQVDGGQCADACLEDYNNRVTAWQDGLLLFAAEASSALPQGNAQVTMENHTGQTLDLYIDQQQQCRALMNLMCTVQAASGFHVLVAASGDTVIGSETVTLQPGESYTFAVR